MSQDYGDELHVLPPWIVTGNAGALAPAANSDYFASLLGRTSVVSVADWNRRGVATLVEALRSTPGVILQESFGGFEPPRLSIRGSGLDSAPTSRGVALLLDGLPLARADGAFNSGLFDPLLFPRVEVYRGTLHMALTPAVLGGVLNASTVTPQPPEPFAFRVQAGGSGAVRGQFTAATGALHAAASFQRSDGWRAQSAQDRLAARASAQIPFSDNIRLEIGAYAATAGLDVPGPLTLANALAHPRSVSAPVLRDRPHRESRLFRGTARLKSTTPAGDTELGLAWLRLSDDFLQLQPNGGTDLNATALSGNATLSRHLQTGFLEHRLLVRGTATTGRDEATRYLNDRSQRGATFARYNTRADTLGLSVEDVVWLRPRLALGAGFTALHGRRAISGRAPTPALRERIRFDDISGRAAALWSPGAHWSVSAAVSRGIEPPTFDDLLAVQGAFPNLRLATRSLDPQSAVTCELGVRGSRGRFAWDVTAYHADWRNEILRLADAAGLPRGAVNAGRTVHQGIESSLRWRIVEGAHQVSLTATSTVGRFKFDNDPVYGNNRLAGAPPHTGRAELLYEHPRGIFAAIEGTWAGGRIPVDHANRLTYGGHALGHVRFGWRSRNGLTLFAAVRNVLDREHIASTAGVLDIARNPAATGIFLPGAGRTLTLGVEWKVFATRKPGL